MSAEQPLTSILEQWLRLTRAETAAIRADAWSTLIDIQTDKARLRQPLVEAKKEWRARPSWAPNRLQFSKPVRTAIGRLIALEQHNADLLAARRQKTQEQLAHLGQATRNLLRIKKSYASAASLPRRSWV
jgi:hypothetical protein